MQKNYGLAAGAPRRRGAPCHGTNGTMVNPALMQTMMMQTIMKRKLGLFGYICRLENSRKIKSVMLGIMDGKGRRGRPNMEWIENIKEWCNKDLYSLTIICTRPKTLETND